MSASHGSIRLPVLGAVPSEAPKEESLLDTMLREQHDLSAVERFSQFHDQAHEPLQEKYYRSLIPASAPGPGQQYAFQVDLDKCSGCKACVTACHNLNGLDDGETWRSVGLLHGGTVESPVQKTVTTACHHCIDPACMSGCPTKAYDKDPETGIVKHLDDQCIGCQYCIFTCPYEVPQFNKKLGIVRKCDMCSDRLAVGEAPACVQACPSEAISIAVVDEEQALEAAQLDAFLPGAPPPSITVPTTVFKNNSALPPNLMPADFYAVRPAHQHMPLVWMLVLTQLSVGALLVDQILGLLPETGLLSVVRPYHAVVALGLGIVALVASTMHLGRPQYAWRAFLGLRTSWLSREIMAFGAFAGAAAFYATTVWLGDSAVVPGVVAATFHRWAPIVGASTAVIGLGAVFCSAMIYHVTMRRWWHFSRTGFKFLMTSVVLGLSLTIVIFWVVAVSIAEPLPPALIEGTRIAGAVLMIATAGKLMGESLIFLYLRDRTQGDLKRSALLLKGELAKLTFFRFASAGVGGLLVPLFLLVTATADAPLATLAGAGVAFALLLIGELLERMTFFGAMSAPRMPGGVP